MVLTLFTICRVEQMYFNTLMPMESEREFWRNYEIISEDWVRLKELVKIWNRLEKIYQSYLLKVGFSSIK